MTSPGERRARRGYEDRVPRTSDEFTACWEASPQYAVLMQEVDNYEAKHPSHIRISEFAASRGSEKSGSFREKSPYTLSYWEQIKLCIWRDWRRLVADPAFSILSWVFNLIISLVLGSMFYNLKEDSDSFYYRGALIFFALLFNAFSSQLEVDFRDISFFSPNILNL